MAASLFFGLNLHPVREKPHRPNHLPARFRVASPPDPTRAHLSVNFRRWDPSWAPWLPFAHLPSNITWGANWALRDALAGDYAASPASIPSSGGRGEAFLSCLR